MYATISLLSCSSLRFQPAIRFAMLCLFYCSSLCLLHHFRFVRSLPLCTTGFVSCYPIFTHPFSLPLPYCPALLPVISPLSLIPFPYSPASFGLVFLLYSVRYSPRTLASYGLVGAEVPGWHFRNFEVDSALHVRSSGNNVVT